MCTQHLHALWLKTNFSLKKQRTSFVCFHLILCFLQTQECDKIICLSKQSVSNKHKTFLTLIIQLKLTGITYGTYLTSCLPAPSKQRHWTSLEHPGQSNFPIRTCEMFLFANTMLVSSEKPEKKFIMWSLSSAQCLRGHEAVSGNQAQVAGSGWSTSNSPNTKGHSEQQSRSQL